MARHRFGVAILLDKGQYKRAMRYNFNRFIQKHGLIGVVNYGAAVYLLAAFVLVQLCRYGTSSRNGRRFPILRLL